jgi:hypothetical protein
MPKLETNRRRIVTRLKGEGWISIGGGDHENFVKPGQRMIQVPAPPRGIDRRGAEHSEGGGLAVSAPKINL